MVVENINNENITYKVTSERQLPKKNENEEESVTEDEDDDSEMGEMIEFTPKEIQMFSREDNDNTNKKRKKTRN